MSLAFRDFCLVGLPSEISILAQETEGFSTQGSYIPLRQMHLEEAQIVARFRSTHHVRPSPAPVKLVNLSSSVALSYR